MSKIDKSPNMNKVQFSHGNGFPSGSYSYLFELLDNVQINFIEKTGHGDYPLNKDLYNFADELIEVHIPGFKGDLYGRNIRISFTNRIRNVEKYSTELDLINQIKNDIEQLKIPNHKHS